MCAPHSKRVANAPVTRPRHLHGRAPCHRPPSPAGGPGECRAAAHAGLGFAAADCAQERAARIHRRSTALRHTGRARTARCQPSLEQRSELCPHLPEMWRSSHSSGMPTRTFACSPHAAARSTTRAWGGRVRAVRAGRQIYILHADDAVMVGLGLGLGLGL